MEKSKKSKIITLVILFALVIVMIGLYLGLPMQKEYLNNNLLGGLPLQTIIKVNQVNQKKIADKLYNEVKKLDTYVNPKLESSDIYRINHSDKNEVVKISDITIKLLEKSKYMYDKTDGLYNPAVFSLVDMWNFSAEKFANVASAKEEDIVLPSTEQIELGKNLANKFANIEFIENNALASENATFIVDKTNKTLVRTERCFIGEVGAKLDLGGIAKGYVTERCFDIMSGSIAERGSINLAGNVYVYNEWKVGIENPFNNLSETPDKNKAMLCAVTAKDTSISSSGVYIRNYTKDGNFYHHIINPNTGYPQQINDDNIYMATVISKDGAVADALATSLVLLGTIEKAEQFVKANFTDIAVILVTKDKHFKVVGNLQYQVNQLLTSEENKEFIQIND